MRWTVVAIALLLAAPAWAAPAGAAQPAEAQPTERSEVGEPGSPPRSGGEALDVERQRRGGSDRREVGEPGSPPRSGGEGIAGSGQGGGVQTVGGAQTSGGASSGAQPQLLDRIAAVVNDEIITLSEVDEQIPPGQATGPEARARVRRAVLDRLIEAALVAQEAARANVTVSEREVDAEIASVREREKLSEDDLVRALAAEGLTLKEYRQRLADNIRRAKVIGRVVRGSLTVPEARLKAYYEAHRGEFTRPAMLRLRLLLLPLGPDATDAERAVVRAEAQALRLRAINGEPFEALVQAHSRGPAAGEGGDLGIMQSSQLDPRFAAAVQNLEPGQVSGPVAVETGIALLELVERQGGQPSPFEAVRDEIYRRLYDEEFEQALTQWVKDLRARAAIEVRL